MKKQFQLGDFAYLVENNMRISKVQIMRKNGKFYIIKFVGKNAAIQVSENRLFITENDALNTLAVKKVEKPKRRLNHYDYGL